MVIKLVRLIRKLKMPVRKLTKLINVVNMLVKKRKLLRQQVMLWLER